MIKLSEVKGKSVLPNTPNFLFDEVLQNNLMVKGYEGYDFNCIDDMDILNNVYLHAIMLQEFRDWRGKGVGIESWYRPELYNDVVLIEHKYKSTKTSDHKCIKACATDTNVPVSSVNINKWKEICNKHGVNWSIGLYSWGLHLGWRREQANRLWDWR